MLIRRHTNDTSGVWQSNWLQHAFSAQDRVYCRHKREKLTERQEPKKWRTDGVCCQQRWWFERERQDAKPELDPEYSGWSLHSWVINHSANIYCKHLLQTSTVIYIRTTRVLVCVLRFCLKCLSLLPWRRAWNANQMDKKVSSLSPWRRNNTGLVQSIGLSWPKISNNGNHPSHEVQSNQSSGSCASNLGSQSRLCENLIYNLLYFEILAKVRT